MAHTQQTVAAPVRFNKRRTETVLVPYAYALPIDYVSDWEWGRHTTAFIRADGDLSRGDTPQRIAVWAQDVGGPPVHPPPRQRTIR